MTYYSYIASNSPESITKSTSLMIFTAAPDMSLYHRHRFQRRWVSLIALIMLLLEPSNGRFIPIIRLFPRLFGASKRRSANILQTDFAENLISSTIDAYVKTRHNKSGRNDERNRPHALGASAHQSTIDARSMSKSNSVATVASADTTDATVTTTAPLRVSSTTTDADSSSTRFLARIPKSLLVASTATVGGVAAFVLVQWILWRCFSRGSIVPLLSWNNKISVHEWEAMCRDQEPLFWEREIAPELMGHSSSLSSSTRTTMSKENGDSSPPQSLRERPDLQKRLVQKMKPSMKQRQQLKRKVSRIIERQWKHKRRQVSLDWTEAEQELVALYYAEMTCEKLYTVTEGLRHRLERANRKSSTVQRYIDRSLLVEGMKERIRKLLLDKAALGMLLEESYMRHVFKDSLRGAIIATGYDVVVDDDEDEDDVHKNQVENVDPGVVHAIRSVQERPAEEEKIEELSENENEHQQGE